MQSECASATMTQVTILREWILRLNRVVKLEELVTTEEDRLFSKGGIYFDPLFSVECVKVNLLHSDIIFLATSLPLSPSFQMADWYSLPHFCGGQCYNVL